ncbi:hypothetical protein [Hymenobacter terricola]|uniref:hypothetical protein n=1 Tax=Hymenobacter terricola TaxID=2819236 RepID=UPI001B312186|nr:hypothetical protein [Hymenobacter terricola]
MRISLESTTKIVELNGVPARIWEGTTESGIPVHCYITRIGVDENEPRQHEFECELLQMRAPSPEVAAIPIRLIL